MQISKVRPPLINNTFKFILSVGLACFCNRTIYAQQFLMSSVGNLQGSSSNSDAIYFKGNSICIKLESGWSTYYAQNTFSEFKPDCVIKEQINSLGIQLFPIPASTTTHVKFTHLPPLQEVFNLSIWNSEGSMITSRKESGQNIYTGIALDVSNLNAGTYILKIASNHSIDAIKFIKAN